MVTFLMSRIGLFQADVICPISEKSIGGMFLRGHTFKSVKVGWPGGCYLMCEEEVTCQSYNFVIGHKVCELNNRTKEARPKDFMPDQTRFYMKRTRTRGNTSILLSCLSPFYHAANLNASLCSWRDFARTPFVLERTFQWKLESPRQDNWKIVKLSFSHLGCTTLNIVNSRTQILKLL